jgi:LysM repeat protein
MSVYRSTPLRILAPVALVAFGVALLMVLSSYGSGTSKSAPSANESAKQRDLGTSSHKTTRKKTGNRNKLPSGTYTVRSGDNLGTIAQKTGIPVPTLQELNPQVDPQTLTTGQKIKLK